MEDQKPKQKLLIGIDPGDNTGMAFWYCGEKTLKAMQFKTHISAILYIHSIQEYLAAYDFTFKIEDARRFKKRPDLEFKNIQKLQGVGSVKARSKDWEEYCLQMGYKYILCDPKNTPYKNSPELFKKLTGLVTHPNNSHIRDATLLVYGH